MTKINAADAMLKVIESWGVKNIYGLPGGSFDSTMNALHNRQDTLNYVQVRHEEVGALAAVGEAKVTGKIGVTFGSAGPGAVHLLNGLYDAQYDHVPVLALVGQVPTSVMNTNYFQEMNENPMFADVSVYNRTIMTAEQLPHVVDEAIRQAYAHQGVAVLTLPKDLGWQEIEDDYVSSANLYQKPIYPAPDLTKVDEALALLKAAKHPLIYVGQGIRGAREDLIAFSEKMHIPIVTTALAKGIVPDSYKGNMGSAGRVASKPGVEVARGADTVLFLGSDFPFQPYFIAPDAKYIQVDIDGTKFKRRHSVDVAILADAHQTLKALLDRSEPTATTPWYEAALANKANWRDWLTSLETDDSTPLHVEPVFKAINDMATDDAIFQTDVGNVTINGMRFLKADQQQRFTTSGWYATMGYALPAAIGAQSYYPDRQVWSISGDGGWAMVMQDVLTQVKYHMPIINVILTNQSLGFIEGEQDDNQQPHSGVDLIDGDFGDAAKALGADGYEVHNLAELKAAFAAAKDRKGPVVIDVKISNLRPLPVEQLQLDPETQDPAQVAAFVKQYRAEGLVPFRQLLADAEAKA
ncbi:pyruvate oxidase [Loigolactobacillus bifermentans]|uniref:Pyruvate oxidase n=1 Tax=Loigolactobacillus bifermentans DSM 20003 TaxID=1423726 RepID=A0A0R1GW02_9LACO|nr:pyruvate oxidase [Loigolactobacillus bifermentans]KRK35386.1 pyruvate oxidase or other thiamine pyrophosphate-requiring enzyme [Loigolactobacillus bifermentans DSM 20003]QGG60374.1 pyruvate oxidase [Loigolactobacillus bifermentans]